MLSKLKYLIDIININEFNDKNTVIIGRKNSGKTTFLFQYFQKISISNNNIVIVIDSATEHKNKSLINKIIKTTNDYFLINSPKIDKIINNKIIDIQTTYPYQQLINNSSKHILIDVSKYLEYSYEIDDKNIKLETRKIYQKLLEQYFLIIEYLFCKATIIMDEIEFTNDINKILNRLYQKKIFFINSIHDIKYLSELNNVNLINADSILLEANKFLKKEPEELCGNTCIEVIASIFYNKICRIQKPLIWCAELANNLNNVNIETKLICWNSQLYDDYKKQKNIDFEGFQSIKDYEKNNKIEEKEISIDSIKNELKFNKCAIYCIDPSFLDETNHHNGHYIILYQKMDDIYCLNPQKTIIQLKEYNIEKVAIACKVMGGWRILCKK